MKNKPFNLLALLVFFLTSAITFGQPPDLGVSVGFALFSTDAAVTNSGTGYLTHITGNVGSNGGSVTGFGNVNGQMHAGGTLTSQCSLDVQDASLELALAIPDSTIGAVIGNGDTLLEGVYLVPSAASLNLSLYLDAKGNPNAVFIFQIQGLLDANAHSKIKLINGAMACNVFWKIDGGMNMAIGSFMKGTIISGGAISMNTGDTIEGRALTTTGAISVNGVLIFTPIGCGSPTLTGPAAPTLGEVGCYGIFSSDGPITNSGITQVLGDVGANVGLTTGYDSLLVTGNIHPKPDSSTQKAATDLLVVYNYLNGLAYDIELLYPEQFGNNLVLTPHTYLLNAATTFIDTLYLNAQENANAVFVIKIYGALSTNTYSKVVLTNGTQAKNVYWLINGAVDINDYTVFNGTVISQGAINLFSGVTVNGRVLTGVGAIETHAINSAANIPSDCETVVGGGTSINEVKENEKLVTVYPNPFHNTITITVNNTYQTNTLELRIYNVLGEEVMSEVITNHSTTINTRNLLSGVYFFKVSDGYKTIQSGRMVSQQ